MRDVGTKLLLSVILVLSLLVAPMQGQVTRIELDIAGYLCGF